jgi:serine/threonine protein kinase
MYHVLGQLGEGGMGQVFFGRSPGGRPVAVKLIRHEYARRQQFRARFAREVEAARRVGGFHTALVVDADPDADPPWMATAYIPGPSLHVAVTELGPLAAQAVRTLGAGLAEGLAAVHACGLVHRDLKPGNVILATDGPRIIDFGIARTEDASGMTATGDVPGTYSYMSPEQVNGHPVGPAGDVFSLGSVLGFAATGRNPFAGETIAATLHRITSEPPDLHGVPVEGGLQDLIAACLAKDPAARPQLADVLARLAGPWPSGDWLPPAIMGMITSRAAEAAADLDHVTGESAYRLHGQPTASVVPESTKDSPASPERSSTVDPARGRMRVGRRALLLAGLVVTVVVIEALVILRFLPESATPSAGPPATSQAAPPAPPAARPTASKRVITDDGRAFGPGGWSQFTVRVDPVNTGVRLTRRLDSGVYQQSAMISVNGAPGGEWEPVDGVINTWLDQTVELPASLTSGQRNLTIRNTFQSSSKDFNEFTYLIDQRIDGAWVRADVVDVGPGHRAQENAHRYRIANGTWEGTQSFPY